MRGFYFLSDILIDRSMLDSTSDGFGPPRGLIMAFMLIFLAVPIFMLVAFVKNLIQSPKRAENAGFEQTEFLNSLDSTPQGIEESYQPSSSENFRWSKAIITCFQCGNSLTLQDQFYPNCGDTTEDEREFVRKNK